MTQQPVQRISKRLLCCRGSGDSTLIIGHRLRIPSYRITRQQAGRGYSSPATAYSNNDQTHPLARKPMIGNSSAAGSRSSGSGSSNRRATVPGGSPNAKTQSWSTSTALLLATLTGASTYVLGTRNTSISSSSDVEARPTTVLVLPKKPTMPDFHQALSDLRNQLPEDCFSTDVQDLIQHGSSSWTYHDPTVLPGAVIYPRNTADVVTIAKTAYKYAIPVVPYSGGTSLEGHFDAPSFANKDQTSSDAKAKVPLEQLSKGPTFVIDFGANMNEIVQLHESDMDVVVQPGMPYEQLNEELKPHKLFFPVDPGPGAEIGGMVGTGCSGTNAVRYGTMRENVLNLTVVLPNGEIIKTRSRARKSSAGPDLTRLFIGSEGTLGLIVEATLKLAPLLPTSVGVSSFPSLQAAADAVRDVVQQGVMVQCVEIMDDLMMKAVNKAEATTKGTRHWQEKPSLFFKFNGSQEQIKLDMARTAEIVKRNGGADLITATSEDERESLWRARKVALFSALAYQPGSRCWTTDVCVPISKFPQLVAETQDDLKRLNIVSPICGHAGDGNFHGLLLFRNDEELERVKEGVHNMVERAQRLEGTCTGEHGVGYGKMKYLPNELGEGTVEVLRRIKQQIDPKNIMNPGKLVEVEYAA